MTGRFDAIVVGAGPAGSSAAILLARAGWRVALVEKAAFPRRKVCGEYISGAAWPLLEALGVGSSVASRAGPEVRRVGLYGDEAVVDAPMPGTGTFRGGRAIGREHLDTLLVGRAREAGVEVMERTACEAVRGAGADRVCDCTSADRSFELRARVVLAAHGAWETGALPTQGAHASAAARDLLGFKAHFRGAKLPPDLMPLVLFPGGYGGMVTTDAERVSLSCCVRRDALARARARHSGLRAGEALARHIAETNRGVRETLATARLEGAWLSAGPIRPAIRAFRAGGVFALGNCAAEAHPIIAEGISMAIQSSFLLCEPLVRAGADATEAGMDAVAQEYEAAWRRNFAARVRAAAAFASLTTRPSTRRLAIAFLAALPSLLTLGAHWSGKDAPLRGLAWMPRP